MFGVEWVNETWKYIQEDKVEHYRFLMNIAPLARSPMDKKSAHSLAEYGKKVGRVLSAMVPWKKGRTGRMGHLRDKVKSGEVVMMLDGNDLPKELYDGVKTIRE